MLQVSDCGTFFTIPDEKRAPMNGTDGECTFCFKLSIMRDANLGVEYCEYHAKALADVMEKEKKNNEQGE